MVYGFSKAFLICKMNIGIDVSSSQWAAF